MSAFFLCRKDDELNVVNEWASEVMKHMREDEGFGYPKVAFLDPAKYNEYVVGLYYECSEEKKQELMKKYGWTVNQTKNGIDFMASLQE